MSRKRQLKLKKEKGNIYKSVGNYGGAIFETYAEKKENETVFYLDVKTKENRLMKFGIRVEKKGEVWIYGKEEKKEREICEEAVIGVISGIIEKKKKEGLKEIEEAEGWKRRKDGKELKLKNGWVLRIATGKEDDINGNYKLYIKGEVIEEDFSYKNVKRAERLFLYRYVFEKTDEELRKG